MTRLTIIVHKDGTIFRKFIDMGPNTPTVGLRISIPATNHHTFMTLEIVPGSLTWSVWRQEYIFDAAAAGLGPWLESHGFMVDKSYETY